jgi:hypothetical protein
MEPETKMSKTETRLIAEVEYSRFRMLLALSNKMAASVRYWAKQHRDSMKALEIVRNVTNG